MSGLTITQLEAIAGTISTRQASEVESNWGSIVEEAGEIDVVLTNDEGAVAVVLSAKRYAELQVAARTNDPLHRLREEFDRELASLRAPDAGDKLRKIFAVTPQEIADSANAPSADDE